MNNDNFNDQDDILDSNDNLSSGSKGGRGFASMNPSKQREIASKGGKAAHRQGTAHEWNSIEAKEAGSKGGRNKKN